jgi:hypothetical protein
MSTGVVRTRLLNNVFAVCLCLALGLQTSLGAAAQKDRPIIFKAGQRTAYAQGQFSRDIHEVYFSFYAYEGQHLRVKVTSLTPDLVTAGIVIYPSGKQDGGPGGVVFDSDLTETGKYRLSVTPRQTNTVGKFRILLEISTLENKKESTK